MKRGKILLVTLVLSLILSLGFFSHLIFAAEAEHVDLAYECLQSKIDTRGCNDLSLQEQAFTLLAINECKDEIIADKTQNNCWSNTGSGACNIKPTAQAVFALSGRRVNTTESEKWLLTQTQVATGLEWFLEIEIQVKNIEDLVSDCTVKYGGGTYVFQINEQRKITTDAGACLIRTPEQYWFKIQPSCLEKEFKITCDAGFLTTLLFKKQGSGTLNILDSVHTAVANGETTEKVNALCFKEGSVCTYEGTLWATFALWAKGRRGDAKSFIPYLTAMKEGNERFLPESFLYFMTGKFQQELLTKQRFNSYWEVSGNRYYDTALALWPMRYETSFQKGYAIDWLLTTQDDSGCWHGGNIVDTAFILRSVWPEYAPECRADDDCPTSEKCNVTTNLCYSPYTPPTGCQNNGDCVSPRECNTTTHLCYLPSETGCQNNGDCVSPRECNTTTHLCYIPKECTRDKDCNWLAGERCSDQGVCYNPDDTECGNNILEPGEMCDTTKLDGKTCASIINSAWSGTIACYPKGNSKECKFNTSLCVQNKECGLGEPDCPEGKVCNAQGYCEDAGTNPYCGDNNKDDGEQCDGYDYNGQTCEIIRGAGWSGTLHCDDECILDLSDCKESSECRFNFQCPSNKPICEGGVCVARIVPPPEPCTKDLDCEGANEICENGNCIEDNTTKPCSHDWQCPGGDCINGACVEIEPCDCVNDFDCSGDLICEDCNCIERPNPSKICQNDFDCPGDLICNNGSCINKPPINCTLDADCPGIEVCLNGTCVYEIECTDDYDCSGSDICVNGTCTIENLGCTNDFDCPGIQECVAGNCLTPGNNNTPDICEDDYDCDDPSKICVEGICSDEEEFDCQASGYFCMPSSSCTGNIMPLYYLSCDYPFDCCDESLPVGSCFEENGQICLSEEICVGGTEIVSSDLDFGEVCCIGGGYCVEKQEGTPCEIDRDCTDEEECVEGYCESKYQGQTCESKQGVCRPTSCQEKEKVSYTYECNYGDTCCLPDKTSNSKGIWLIIILLILVAFVVAGIVFRDKLKVYWLKIKSKFDKGKKPMHGRSGTHPPGTSPKKQGLLDKIKGFFTGKKQKPIDFSQRNLPQKPMRGPLAIQHAQRQAQQPSGAQRQVSSIKPEPVKSTSTPFSQLGLSTPKSVKKSTKKTSAELDEVLEKLKKIGK